MNFGNTGGMSFGGSNTGFGGSNPFGSTSGGFGLSNPSGGFGSSAPTGGFAASNPSTGFGTSNPSGGFGASNMSSGFTTNAPGFGSSGTQGGGFGSSGGFGSNQPSGFGSTSGQGSGFGSTSTTGGFGSSGNTGFGGTGTTSGFGSNAPSSGGFGNTGSSGFGTSGGFGSTNTQGTGFGTNTGFGSSGTTGGFGNTGGSGFGSGTSTTNTGFGSTGFGSTSTTGGFGANQNTGFGSSGTTGFGSTGTGFGTSGTGFGSTTTSGFGSTGTSGFGASGPTSFGSSGPTGFGTSGPTSFGSSGTSGFGTSAPSTGFGNTGFGSTGSSFGTPSTGFGTSSSGFGGTTGFGSSGSFNQSNDLAANMKFKPTVERIRDTTSTYMCITRQPEYQNYSLEELRWMFYKEGTAGKLNTNLAPSGFGTSTTSGFGSNAPSFSFGSNIPSSTGFGTGTTSGFGSTGTTSSFGPAGTSSGFGPAGTTSGFGSTTGFGTTPSTSSSGFSFGSSGPSGFGTTGTSTGFGATSSSTPSFNFGASQSGTGPTSGTSFGQSSSTPSFSFGSSNTGSTGFGSSGFGSSGTTGFGTAAGTSGFGTTTSSSLGPSSTGAGTGFNFGTSGSAPSSGNGFNFGTSAPGGGSNFTFSTPTATSGATSTPSFNFGSSTGPTQSGFNFGGSSTAPGSFNFGSTTPATSGFATSAMPNGGFNATPIPTVETDPYGDQVSGFQYVLQRSESEASKVAKKSEIDDKISLNIKRSPALIQSTRPLLPNRMSLFTAADEIGAEGQLDSDSKYLGVKALVIEDESQIELPPLADDDIIEKTEENPKSKPSAAKANQYSSTPSPIPDSKKPVEDAVKPSPRKGVSVSKEIDDTITHAIPSFVPILERKGYGTNPAYEKIREMSANEMTCIQNFQIYNENGSIIWLGETNICGLNLDELVHINNKYVEVYPDPSVKPSQGRGLNKKAIVTLNNIKPRDDIPIEDYIEYLKKVCKKDDSIFLDYDSKLQQWTFEVKHFSRYGLGEEDEEEAAKSKKKIRLEESTTPIENFTTPKPLPTPPSDTDSKIISESGVFLPIAHELGLNPNKLHSMKTYLFAEDDEQLKVQSSEETVSSTPSLIPNLRKPFYASKHELNIKSHSVDITSISSAKITPQNIVPVIQPEYSIIDTKERSMDAALFLGRSFRITIGPGGTLVIPQVHGSKLTIHNITLGNAVDPGSKEKIRNDHIDLFEKFIPFSSYMKDTDPFISIEDGGVFKIAEEFISNNQTTADTHNQQLSIWKLILALWGELPQHTTPIQRELKRKQLLNLWMQDEVRDAISKESFRLKHDEHGYLKLILSYLTGFQLPEAAQAAISEQDYILSMILSQAGLDGVICEDVSRQVMTWMEDDSISTIDDLRLVIYKLLSGDIISIFPHISNADVSCDWKRNFGLHMWYGNKVPGLVDSPQMEQIIDTYETCLLSKKSIYPSPPHWDNQKVVERYSNITTYKPKDILYWLIKRYWKPSSVRLQELLLPINFSSDVFDYRMPWAMYQVLVSLSNSDMERANLQSVSSQIHSNFIFQLESVGLWTYAIYVALHFEKIVNGGNIRRSLFIRDMVIRYIGMGFLSTEDDENLLRMIDVPEEWIFYGRAVRAHYYEDYLEETEYLIRSGHYEAAHQVIIKHLAPHFILSEKYADLEMLLNKLYTSQIDNQEMRPYELVNWEHKGNVYLTFCQNIRSGSIVLASEGLAHWRFQYLNSPDHEHAAISQMTTELIQMLSIASQTDVPKLLGAVADQFYMPEQYKANLLIHSTLKHLRGY